MRPTWLAFSVAIVLCATLPTWAVDGNRLTYLDEFCDPYYPGLDTAQLVTEQWIGEPGVEAVIVLSVDDMRDPAPFERFLRPILDRLKKIDGRAPVSIITNQIDPKHPQLQSWLEEGLSFEAHTIDHPCPCLHGGDLARAKSTYDRCVDLLTKIPDGRPVAFRMPCGDSMNSMSPRFFTEIFNKTTANGNFLTMDSSIFTLTTPADPELPRRLVFDENGRQKFRKYVPHGGNMVNRIDDYPYPYVIGRLCWECPLWMPSDWDAQHLHGSKNPITVRDLKAAVDALAIKRGVCTLVFHAHGWIDNHQLIEVIDMR